MKESLLVERIVGRDVKSGIVGRGTTVTGGIEVVGCVVTGMVVKLAGLGSWDVVDTGTTVSGGRVVEETSVLLVARSR